MTMDVSAVAANPSMVNLDAKAAVTEAEQATHEQKVQQAAGSQEAALQEEPAKELDSEALMSVTDELNDMMSLMRKGLAFRVDEDSGQSVVSVMDVASGDVIRQIPNEEALELAQKLAEVAGFLLKTEA
ncbi:flagellar protein FlaG [Shewanella fidelis]|uniref:Flagellar protein FlaG n=1 Tax=Shewanella fidelis TaxID=173509 RepID=A0AAW8NRY2_9GAMM|nr:flagellar protein FlaG [Shewanella fidelis]MDR8524478.1 flagellar protein FlaG [Shewanella fidelis]MDW4811954.1 flagellar protein FlaG [Shewanella fidelis]MDW4817107.1 flagellar protein FlaG [Shewanella fidelis]MDW4821177.1 flagellar protein FlaG [Shewanella fidelis]MDW4822560.1 flagellar protein FlaG [Shewanella fidelis]